MVVVVVVSAVVRGGEVSAIGATLMFVVVRYPLPLAGVLVSELVTATFLFKCTQKTSPLKKQM